MSPIKHIAASIVGVVIHHSILVSNELHPGIDLARQLCSGEDVPMTTDVERRLTSTWIELQKRYERLALLHNDIFRQDTPIQPSWPAATGSAKATPTWPAANA